VNRIMKKGGKVTRARDAITVNGKTRVPGSFIVGSQGVSHAFMEGLAAELSLEVESLDRPDFPNISKLRVPRIALYKSWRASMDEGWTRWVLEQYEFPFVNVYNAELKAGSLRDKYDTLVIPSMSTEAIVNGNRPGTIPPDYVGGISDAGVANIIKFVRDGGTLITLNSGCHFAIDKMGVPARDVLSPFQEEGEDEEYSGPNARAPQFFCPGSILRMNFNPRHPVAYGMPEQGAAVFYYSPAFQLLPADPAGKEGTVIASYPDESLLISGYIKGEQYLRNMIAAAEIPMDKGKVILLGFGVQNRAQSYGTFKLLFNALLN
jgi:hypothetical protein